VVAHDAWWDETGWHHHFWKLLVGLGLDDKQKEAVKAIRSKMEKENVKKKADLQLARIDLRDLLGRDEVDIKSVETTLKKMASLQSDIRLDHIKAIQDIKALLTPEQRSKLKELREMGPMEKKAMHGEHRMNPADENQEG